MMVTLLQFEDLLFAKQYDDILRFLLNSEYEEEIESNLWSYINKMCIVLKNGNIIETGLDFEKCKNILLHLVRRGSPKEMLIALLEEADTFKKNSFFCVILQPLQDSLLRVPNKRGKSFEWILSSLNAHIKTLPLPKNRDLQGDEKLLLDSDPAVLDTVYVLQNYLDFLVPFVEEIYDQRKKCKSDKFIQQRNILANYILHVFDHPFLYQDLHISDTKKPKSSIRLLCEEYIKQLFYLFPNYFTLFEFNIFDRCIGLTEVIEYIDDCDLVPSIALSNVAYLSFGESLGLNYLPLIYTHKYVFICCLKCANLLLSKTENLILFKGLHLIHFLLERIDEFEIIYDFVELEEVTKLSQNLISIATLSEVDAHRKAAVEVFRIYIIKCDWKGRYHTIMQVIDTSNHSGAKGLVINLYKDYLNYILHSKMSNSYFLGSNLKVFLDKILILKDGVESDILEDSDKIITSLNFLIYLFLRDTREVNATGIWDMTKFISEEFLEPLLLGLKLSTAHYNQVLKDSMNQKKEKKRNDIVKNLIVDKSILENVPLEFQKDVCERAILTFDMIESIVFRVQDLI